MFYKYFGSTLFYFTKDSYVKWTVLLNFGDWLYVIVFVAIGIANKRFIQEEVLNYSFAYQ